MHDIPRNNMCQRSGSSDQADKAKKENVKKNYEIENLAISHHPDILPRETRTRS